MVNIKDFNLITATPKYERQMRELWAVCFPEDADGFADFYFAECYDEKSAYLATLGGKVCAMLYAPLMKYRMCGVDFTVPYIQGVATVPSYRRLGLANTLLAYALNDLHNQGAPFGILKPFRVDFYEKSGWRVFAKLAEACWSSPAEMNINADFLTAEIAEDEKKTAKPVTAAELKLRRVKDMREIDAVDLPGLGAAFESWQQAHRNNYPLRKTEDWRLLLSDHFNDGGALWLVEHEGKALAYALLMEKAADGSAAEEIFIRELAAGGKIALTALITGLKRELPPRKLRLCLPANQRLTEDFQIAPFAMARVINVETLFSAARLGLTPTEERIFRIRDNIVAGNNGVFALSRHENGSCCRRLKADISEEENFAKKIPEIPINLLTCLLFRWYNNGKMADKQESFAELFAEIDDSYFNEYFR